MAERIDAADRIDAVERIIIAEDQCIRRLT